MAADKFFNGKVNCQIIIVGLAKGTDVIHFYL
jgi:hypothetical protein